MGWNSTLVVLNDALHQIKEDKSFGEKVYNAVGKLSLLPNCSGLVDISAGNHVNAAHAVETHHADRTALVAVGQNYGRSLGIFFPYGEEDDESVRVLKELARKLGYVVYKKNAQAP
jgi:hypothetical protein